MHSKSFQIHLKKMALIVLTGLKEISLTKVLILVSYSGSVHHSLKFHIQVTLTPRSMYQVQQKQAKVAALRPKIPP
jgi:hypothetical protein